MPGDVYLLDANVFIEASKRYYAFDIAPAFWEALVQNARDGRVVSIDRVRDELERIADDLWVWARHHFNSWFDSTDDVATIGHYADIAQWVQAQSQFTDPAKAAFYDSADGWLVAYALNGGYVVVTHERPSPGVRNRIPIPNICAAFGVRFADTFEMLRELGVKWT